MTLRVFLAAVKRHWKTFAIAAGVVFAVGLTWLLLTPAKYVSTTRLMVSVEGSTTAAAYQNDGVVTGRINTYIALLTTDAVTQRVIDKLKLPESPHELAEQVNATNVPPRTSLIDIAVTDESAERARLIAQTLAEEFVKFADATETPTGEDAQKVHTTVVTAATAPQQQRAERVALGGLAALVALILGATAVWIRSARDPILEMAGPDAISGGVPPVKTVAPARRGPSMFLEGYRRLRKRLRSISDRSHRTWGVPRIASGGQQPDAAPSMARPGMQPRAHLEAAKPRERTPWLLGFLCLLIPILPSYVVPAGPLKSNGSPAKLIAALFFGLAVLGFVLIRRAASTRTVQPGVVVILFYFLLQLAVYGVGMIDPGSALVEASRTRALINLVANVGVALYVVIRVHTTRQRNIVLGCLAIGLAFACLAALLQSSTHIDLRFFFQPPGFVINAEDFELSVRSGVTRVVGTSLHPIEFSILAAVTVPLAIYFARNAATWPVRWAALLVCGLGLVSMPSAVSRTGVIALAVALFVYMWNFTVRQIAVALAAGSALLIGYVIVAPGVASALWGSITGAREDDSIQARIADYAQVSQTFHDHPVFGLGLGGSPPTEYGLLDNEWLQAIVQGGIVGVTAMILLVVGGIFGFTAALRSATTPGERDQAYVLGSMFIGIAVCSFFFDLFNFQQATRILFIIFGLMWSSFTISLPRAGPGDPRPLAVQDSRRLELAAPAAR